MAILQKGESLGGKRVMGPDKVMEGVAVGQILDPEGRLIEPSVEGTIGITRDR